MSDNSEILPAPITLAIVVDGEVAVILNCHEQLAAAIQSNPTVIDVSDRSISSEGPNEGWLWDGESFTNPFDVTLSGTDLPLGE
jgi:hypothetical protein